MDNLAFGVELSASIIEVILAFIAIATLPKEWTKRRKDRVKHQFEVLGVVAASIFLVAFISNHRIGVLRDERLSGEMRILDPLNHPVSEISVNATILFRSTNGFGPLATFGPQLESWVELLEMDMDDKRPRTLFLNGFQRLPLDGNSQSFTSSSDNGSYQGISAHFHPNRLFGLPANGFLLSDNSPMTPRRILDKIKVLAFHLDFAPQDAEIVSGSVEILVNGAFPKIFQIVAATNTASVFYARIAVP